MFGNVFGNVFGNANQVCSLTFPQLYDVNIVTAHGGISAGRSARSSDSGSVRCGGVDVEW